MILQKLYRSNSRYIRDIKEFHVSWLIATGCTGIIAGVILSLYIGHFRSIEWVIVSLCLFIVSIINKKYFGVLCVLVAGVIFGVWRGGLQLESQTGFEQFYNTNVSVVGQVSEDPTYDSGGDLRMRLKNVEVNGNSIGGELWSATSQRVDVKRSDVVSLQGSLTKGFGNIPAAVFRSRISEINRQDYADIGRDTRDWFASGIRESVREPEASLGSGFLLGQKTALPEKLDNELRLLGLTHIVVASGYNLTILVRFARRAFAKVSRFTGLTVSAALVYGFVQVTGYSPSMTRAALITAISLLAWYYGRKMHPLVLLPFSAAITVVINPAYAWGDIGWLLSFTSFIGVILLSPLIHAYFWGEDKPGNIRQVTVETLSAQLLTLPIIVYVFGQYSPLALLANLLILPFIPVAMGLTAIAGAGGILLPAHASIIGWPAETLMGYMTVVVDYLATWPLASSEIEFSLTTVIVSYIAIFTLLIFLWRRTGYKLREYNVIE